MPRDDYQLIDSGDGRRLERYGEVVVDRPLPYAIWRRGDPGAWRQADGVYHRSNKGGGEWEWRRPPPDEWTIAYGGLQLRIQPTGFGHMGLFSEQAENWQWLREASAGLGKGGEVLNLFGYTGGSSLAAAQGGARVCHLDASKGVVNWARENARRNHLDDHPIRWITEDAGKFVAREVRRERAYAGLVLDPPSFGRGTKGKVFKIERDLPDLLGDLARLHPRGPRFVLLSCHSAGFTPRVLGQLVEDAFGAPQAEVQVGEMVVPAADGRVLPSGSFARWRST